MTRAAEIAGDLDLFLARAAFTIEYDCTVPEIRARPQLRFDDARYLPLVERLEHNGESYAPISLDLGYGVLTGPNMGGKTAALRTCGFLAACVATGVPVPARTASCSLFDAIVWLGADGAAGESGPESLLSAFGREIVAVRESLDRGAVRSLVLLDEFARTTAPDAGRALLIALLRMLAQHPSIVLATTHFSNVAGPAGYAHFAVAGLRAIPLPEPGESLASTLDRLAAAMDYSIECVGDDRAGTQDALTLAALLGIPQPIIDAAREYIPR
jgi:dsDNA-specific endonuclease/ATPase MutS2